MSATNSVGIYERSGHKGQPRLLNNVNVPPVSLVNQVQERCRFRNSLRNTKPGRDGGGDWLRQLLLLLDNSDSLQLPESLLLSLSDDPHVGSLLLPHPQDLVHPLNVLISVPRTAHQTGNIGIIVINPLLSTASIPDEILDLSLLTYQDLSRNAKNIGHIRRNSGHGALGWDGNTGGGIVLQC